MAEIRETQLVNEVLRDGGADVRETQLVEEVLSNRTSSVRETQLVVESAHNAVAVVFGTQLVMEVLCDVDYFSIISYNSIGDAIFGSVIIR